MRRFFTASAIALGLTFSSAAHAHFQLIYTPDINVKKAGDIPLKLLFWHPMSNGHVMKMDEPLELYSLFKGEKTDLKPSLKAITFQGAENTNQAFDASLSVKRNGDYTVIATPAPYYEESEDLYIQQITKSVINKGDVPTNWNEAVGLKTEIVPLNKPYGVVTGSTFSGVVLSNGKPVSGAEIEVEYMSSEPDIANNKPTNNTSMEHRGGAISVITGANGTFTFGIPKAGFWGFAALGTGPDTEFNGKELSQDAVLWIKAHGLGE